MHKGWLLTQHLFLASPMAHSPQISFGESGGGCRLCEGSSLHPADRHGLGVHFHSFIFIHSFNQQTYIEHVPHTEHCARQWDHDHEQNTFFDLPPFSTGCCQRRTLPCPKAVLLVGAMLPSKRHWAMSRDIFSCHDL